MSTDLADQAAPYCRFWVARRKAYAAHNVFGDCVWPAARDRYPQPYCRAGQPCSSTLQCSAGNPSGYCSSVGQCSNYLNATRGTIFDAQLSPAYQR